MGREQRRTMKYKKYMGQGGLGKDDFTAYPVFICFLIEGETAVNLW
ncbi:MAG: hypothetical protein LUF85_01835 [Bacteroides sp.]|nr:hypothetical protein [Bacteroides sp.]